MMSCRCLIWFDSGRTFQKMAPAIYRQDLHCCHAFWHMVYTLAQSFPEKHQAHSKLSWAYPGGKHSKHLAVNVAESWFGSPVRVRYWMTGWDWPTHWISLFYRSCRITWGLVAPSHLPSAWRRHWTTRLLCYQLSGGKKRGDNMEYIFPAFTINKINNVSFRFYYHAWSEI